MARNGKGILNSRRGSALIFAILVSMVMMIIGLALASSTLQALRLTRLQRDSAHAFNLAESGAERGLLWLRTQMAPPAGTSVKYPFGTGPTNFAEGSYFVTIIPDPNNDLLDLKRYTVRSVGEAYSRQETIEIFAQQANFGRYAYFTDYERSSITDSAIWFKKDEVIDGPAHSNNSADSPFHINWNGSTQSIFKEQVTAAGTYVNYSPSQPNNEADWQKIYEEGSRGFRLGVNRIELPANTDRQKNAAWGASSGFPTNSGVYTPTGGGIYIVGDSTMTFSVTSEGWQRIAIAVGSYSWTITIKRDSNQTVVSGPSGVVTRSGTTNGVIYSTGHITSVKGVLADSIVSNYGIANRNAFTIATDIVAGKNVRVSDSLYYKTEPNKNEPWSSPTNLRSAALGIVARNVTIADPASTDFKLHAVVLAGARDTTDGSFSAQNWNSRAIGRLNLIGGLIQKKRGPVGTFNASTGQQSTGFDKNYRYDRRMAVNPPPFFPTTGNYERLSWQRKSAGVVPASVAGP